MRILKMLAIVLVVLMLLPGIGGLFLPRVVGAERSVLIDRPAPAVFAMLNSYARFNEWSPWAGLDPNASYTFSGPVDGVGASMQWAGNADVGQGTQSITASEPYSRVATSLDFGPDGLAKAEFLLSEENTGTRVVWRFETDLGGNPYMRCFGLMIENFVGADYERGLAKLKRVLEAERS